MIWRLATASYSRPASAIASSFPPSLPHVTPRQVSPFSMSAYSSSKFAVEAFSDALRQELRGFGIDVVVVEPGAMNTQMARDMQRQREQQWDRGSQ